MKTSTIWVTVIAAVIILLGAIWLIGGTMQTVPSGMATTTSTQ